MNTRTKYLAVGLIVAAAAAACGQDSPRSGLDPARLDVSVRPQDDLFRHVNGAWLASTEIPADRARYGTFDELAERSETDVRALIEGLAVEENPAAGTPAQQVSDLYRTFMDEAAIEQLGASPLEPRLAAIDAVRTSSELAALLGTLSMAGLPGAVGVYVAADVGAPSQTALYLSQGGTALPDRDYYLVNDPKYAEIRGQYRDYLETIFTLAGRPRAAAEAQAVLALETELARLQWTKVESRDAVKIYNKMPVAAIAADMPGFDWAAWARPQGLDRAAEWVIEQPSFFRGLAALTPKTPLDTWKAWTAAQLITQHAPYLSQPFSDARFAFFGTVLTGQQEQRDRWRRGVQLVNGSLGEAVGQLYVARHFPPEAKGRMEQLIATLIEAYRQSITELDWMTPATRAEALAKLEKFTWKIGYPDRWRDYGSLEIRAGDLIGNVERANRLEAEYQIAKLGQPVDRNDWLMTPQTVNAYYDPTLNEIVFPAAILQAPFFDLEADDAENYGAIGAVIGHEIGHGFDDQGRRYDGSGLLRDWWTPEDEAEFSRRTRLLIDQYAGYSPLPGLPVNGELTLGENIGDLGGLSIAYRAWRISLGDRESPVINGLTGERRFFMGWAQSWRSKAREEYLRRQVLADPHAWSEFRANGPLGNIDAFYRAFDVKHGDMLYREPEQRVKIW